ncbi:TPA: hypothetical protein ACFIY1_001594 [Neisseria gonorrhoeae]
MMVDLPAPLCPASPTLSPAFKTKSTWLTAFCAPNRLVTFLNST